MARNNSVAQHGTNGRFLPIELTAQQLTTVKRLGQIGATHAEVAAVVGIDYETVRMWVREPDHPFKVAWEQGMREGKVTLRRKQWRAAMNGNIVMLIWLGKQLLGQRDDPSTLVCVTGADQVQIEGKSPREIRAELIELQQEIWAEAEQNQLADKSSSDEEKTNGD